MLDLSFLEPSFIVFAFIGFLLWMAANLVVLHENFGIPFDVWLSNREGCVDGHEEYKKQRRRYRKGLWLRALSLPLYIPYRIVFLTFKLKDMESELLRSTVVEYPESIT